MRGKKEKIFIFFVFLLIPILLAGIFVTNNKEAKTETIQEVMKDAVLHENDKINLFGIIEVNPGLISAMAVSCILIVFAIVVRIFVIPKFKDKPGKFQLLLETAVGFFDGMAKEKSPHRSGFIGGYIFAAGSYIFISTIFELFGIQVVTVTGHSISLPAPLADINGAIAMGCFTYGVILVGAILHGGFKGVVNALKDFSLPISMSFRLFGALLSGALVTELVYYSLSLSFVLPIIVAVLFTLIHAIIQTFVLTTLASMFYGESTEKHDKKSTK